MTAILCDSPVSETYHDVKLLLDDIIHRFIKQFGGDFEELRAEANVLFLECWKDYDPSKGRFSARLGYMIYYRLIDQRRPMLRQYRAKVRFQRLGQRTANIADQRSMFRVESILSDLSPDAQYVMKLTIRSRGVRRQTFPTGAVNGIRGHLYFTLQSKGWKGKRIRKAFDELREIFS